MCYYHFSCCIFWLPKFVKKDAFFFFFTKSCIFSMWKIKYSLILSVTLSQCKIRDNKIPSSPYEGLHLRHVEDHRRRRWRWNRRSSGVGVGRLRQKDWTPWLLNPFPSSFCQPPKHVRVNNGSSVGIDYRYIITDRSHAAVSCTFCTTISLLYVFLASLYRGLILIKTIERCLFGFHGKKEARYPRTLTLIGLMISVVPL